MYVFSGQFQKDIPLKSYCKYYGGFKNGVSNFRVIFQQPVDSMRNHTLLGEVNGTPLQYSCLENPMDGGAWQAASMQSLRVGHDCVTLLSLFTFMHWRRKWQPTPVFLPGESQGRVGCRLWGRTELDTTEATQQQQQHTLLTSTFGKHFDILLNTPGGMNMQQLPRSICKS